VQKGKDYIGVGVGAIICNDQHQLLLCKRGSLARNERGCWECPGGSVEFGETMVAAVKREMQEELGVTIRIIKQLNAIDHLIPGDRQHWVTSGFIVQIIGSNEPKIMEPGKCDEIGWFALDNLPAPLSIATQHSIVSYQEFLKNSEKTHSY